MFRDIFDGQASEISNPQVNNIIIHPLKRRDIQVRKVCKGDLNVCIKFNKMEFMILNLRGKKITKDKRESLMAFRCYCFQKLGEYLNQAQTELNRGSTIGNPVEKALA